MRSLAAAILLLLALPASSADRFPMKPELRELPGREKKAHLDTILAPLSAKDVKPLVAKLHAIRDLLRATPSLHDLTGFDWETYASVTKHHRAGRPVVARVGYIAFPFVSASASSAEGPPLVIHINDPEAILGGNFSIDEERGWTLEPRIEGELGGFPVYEGGFVALTETPLFTPVSQKRYSDWKVSEARKDYAEFESRVASMPEEKKKDALAQMAARTRKIEAQADDIEPDEPAAEGGRTVVEINPKLFDPRKPNAIQLIFLGTPRYYPEVFVEAEQELDKTALRALME